MPSNIVQTHECVDLDKARLIINLIGITRFIVINKELIAD